MLEGGGVQERDRRRAENKTSKGKFLLVIAGDMSETWELAEKEKARKAISRLLYLVFP